ncbi:DUF2971 domain-containing protein [Pseudidiomarina sediminum]|uniref:DUF2971 domain-containing protein n=1 Tax=Pseudidiomarina sediminum TaxID=431675 RepID=A0A432YZG0_9GAMM|nr:DUF2971 domain-containing protein [Pseudidiomarina sediminum]RUO69004.1 DUF2971 domain-containing protein [Pseudidiomarina sediminum]
MQKEYYKLRTLEQFERIADILVNNRLFCSKLRDLNDPMEGFFHANIEGKGFSTLYVKGDPRRICSLSGSVQSIKLWSQYGDDHKGIAIRFEPETLPQKVTYSNQLYTLGKEEHLTNSEILTKLKEWEYEDEYRYISSNDKFLFGSVTGIVFGIRTPDASKNLIQKMADSLKIPTFGTKLNTKNYTIEILHNQ